MAAHPDAAPVLVCGGLVKRYGRRRVAVDDVGFHIAPGERAGAIGPPVGIALGMLPVGTWRLRRSIYG